MAFRAIVAVIFVLSSMQRTNGANILTIFCTPSRSHIILGTKLVEGLLERGHHVTFLGPFTVEPMENLTFHQLKSILEFKEKASLDDWKENKNNPIVMFQHITRFTKTMNEFFWEDPVIKKLIVDKPKYDLVIMLSFFNDAILGFGPHVGAPTVVFNCIGSSSVFDNYVVNPTMVYSKNQMLGSSTDGFWSRLATVTANMLIGGIVAYQIDPFNQGLLDKYLPNSPPIRDLQRNVSLVLTNSHVTIESPRPYVPNMIQIGGFHVKDPKPLPEEYKKFLDEAEQGAILFSLGSNVQISMLDEERREVILKVLGEMAPIKVIFKSELQHENLSRNIMVKSWVPQADILAHRNVKLFISHGGLGGNTESVYHGVPILGIPFFDDQHMNMNDAQLAGYAQVIQIEDISEGLFRNKLIEVLTNPKYTQAVKRRSSLMREQPVKPLDNAVFWIEHVIKYGGGSHLQNAGVYLTWYQLYMVDIYIFYTVTLVFFAAFNVYAIKLSIEIVKRAIHGTSKVKVKQT